MRAKGCHHKARAFCLTSALFTGAVAVATSTSCMEGEQVSLERSLTSTVTLEGERRLVTNLPIPVTIEGERRVNDVLVTVDLTVTASSSTQARILADMITIEEEHADRDLVIGITEPENARLSGTVRIQLPADLDVKVTERGGTVDVLEVEGEIEVDSLSHVRVTGAEENVDVAVEAGNALVESAQNPGLTTTIRVNAGDVELTLPPAVSADIEAVATNGIVVAHPMLQRWPGGNQPYRASVGGGLSIVRLSTRRGLVVIRSR